jgi:hypothetical protein
MSCNANNEKNIDDSNVINYNFDFGLVSKDTVLNGFFVINNSSERTMNYKNIFTSCDCTTLNKQESDSILKGEKDTVFFKLSTLNMQSNDEINQAIRITTDSKPNLIRLNITGKIK